MRVHKICLVGNVGAGKTSLAVKYTQNVFNPDIIVPTVGAHFYGKQYDVDTRLEIWDCAGQERYRSLTPLYFRKASAVIVVIDATKPQCARDAETWVSFVKDKEPKCSTILVAVNKIDLVENAQEILASVQASLSADLSVYATSATRAPSHVFDAIVRSTPASAAGQPAEATIFVPPKTSSDDCRPC